jgi:phosphonate transport system permease protein
MTVAASKARHWRRQPLIARAWLRWTLYAAAVIYLALALASMQVNWVRLSEGIVRGWRFVEGFLHPNFASRSEDIIIGLRESIAMTICATVAGIALSVPVGVGAARNISPRPVYYLCRSIVAVARSFQEILYAIFFVAMFGFGTFAGFLTITFATIGFLGKLLAEDIEDIDAGQVEAIRATGASWMQVLSFGVAPQVLPRLIGLSLYRFDINFRESAVVGIVGAGGIGATLNTAISRYEYDVASAILILIILVVLVCEYSSSHIRRWVQ